MRRLVDNGKMFLLNSLMVLFSIHCSLFVVSCGTGDDDGSRLGDRIVGTWQRANLEIEGDTEFEPEDFTYDLFVFNADGSYNGMVRQGTCTSISRYGSVIFEGDYKCDNSNLRIEYDDEGTLRKILAQVVAFTDNTLQLQYKQDEYDVTVRLWLNRVSDDEGHSSSVTSDE